MTQIIRRARDRTGQREIGKRYGSGLGEIRERIARAEYENRECWRATVGYEKILRLEKQYRDLDIHDSFSYCEEDEIMEDTEAARVRPERAWAEILMRF